MFQDKKLLVIMPGLALFTTCQEQVNYCFLFLCLCRL